MLFNKVTKTLTEKKLIQVIFATNIFISYLIYQLTLQSVSVEQHFNILTYSL